VWVGLEYARATLFTGFAWNPLGGSQYRTLPIAQVAELGGVYAVSWLVVYMNCALYFTFRRVAARCRGERVAGLHPELMAGLLAVAVALGWGQARRQKLWRESEQDGSVRVVAVQPAIAQTDKWDPETDELVLGRLRDLTSLSGALRPDLVLWPETALPSVFNVDTNAQKFAASLSAAAGAPLLVGALEYRMSAAKDFYYNSSFLVGPDGESGGVYRKQHLVLFGEYLPGEDRHPWIGRFSPLGYSCLPGGESVVFRAAGKPFSPLICFEDTVPALSRAARNAGAGFIVVQTNDAWFDGTPGLQQHMAHSVFRAIENRCPVVRCANTGITCMVDATGGVESMGSGREAALGVAGFHPFEVRPASGQLSFYTVRGDSAFAGPCAILTALLFLLVAVFAARKNRASAAGAVCAGS